MLDLAHSRASNPARSLQQCRAHVALDVAVGPATDPGSLSVPDARQGSASEVPQRAIVELQNMLHPHSARLMWELRALARETGLRVVATNNVHQATKPEFPLQDCLACAGALVTVDEPHPARKTNAE